jgi:hypothetical protein
MKTTSGLAVLFALIATTSVARAHHSFAMYDTDKVVVLQGTVKEFEWTNPHALLWINGAADGGATELWTVELPTSPGNLVRMGWSKHSLQPGQAVSVEINPLRDGQHGGSFKKAKLASGEVLVATAYDPTDAGADGAVSDAAGADGGASAGDGAHPKSGGCSAAGEPPVEGGWPAAIAVAMAALTIGRRSRRGKQGPR